MRKGSARPFALATLALASVWAVSVAAGPAGATGHSGRHAAWSTAPVRGASEAPSAPATPRTVGPNVNITNKPAAQSETAIAVDPTDRKHLLAASNDLAGGATARVYESFDGGLTWGNSGLHLTVFCYDPWLDFNAAGDAFFSYECSDQRVAFRKAGQTTWTTHKFNNAGSFPDRDMIQLDTTAASPFADSAYIGYDDNGNNNAAHLMYSRDGFTNWLQSPKINDGNAPTIGVNAATAPNGTVYATWEDFTRKAIVTDRSTNGAVTWGADHVVHHFRIDTTSFFILIPPQPQRGVLPMPMTEVAPAGTPFAGRLYVTYMDRPVGGGPGTNIYETYSDDGGVTWSPEVKVNDSPNGVWDFHPAIAIAPNGTVGISFYDTRNDTRGKRTDQFIAFSTDGGVTWSANQRITTAPSNESGNGDPNDYGDYQNLDAGPTGAFSAVWTDSRVGYQAEDMASARVRP
jgi:hypothetical protein